jgi:hypothetical protein
MERDTHTAQLKQLKGRIGERHPTLTVEMLLMALDGTAEVIS